MKTKTIAGYKISLEAGRCYIATRPMVSRRGQSRFPVSISTNDRVNNTGVAFVDVMSYDAANAFLAAFNTGRTSFEGRVW